MKRLLILMIVLTFLSACSRSIHPNQIIKTDFDLTEAQVILEKTWEPVKTMTDSKLVTKPRGDLSSREDFLNEYKFLYMDDLVKNHIYESLVVTDKSGKEVKDSKGNLVFDKGDFGIFIPTIYDEGVYIERAYLKETKYKEENSDLAKLSS